MKTHNKKNNRSCLTGLLASACCTLAHVLATACCTLAHVLGSEPVYRAEITFAEEVLAVAAELLTLLSGLLHSI